MLKLLTCTKPNHTWAPLVKFGRDMKKKNILIKLIFFKDMHKVKN
jgi:hypothetical protein